MEGRVEIQVFIFDLDLPLSFLKNAQTSIALTKRTFCNDRNYITLSNMVVTCDI